MYDSETKRMAQSSRSSLDKAQQALLEHELSMYDLELLFKSDSEVAGTVGTILLTADMLLDKTQNTAVKEVINGVLNILKKIGGQSGHAVGMKSESGAIVYDPISAAILIDPRISAEHESSSGSTHSGLGR